jgi:hypothetical protein
MYFPVDIHTDLLCYSAVLLGGAQNYTPDFGFAISAWLLEIATAGGVSRAELRGQRSVGTQIRRSVHQYLRIYGHKACNLRIYVNTELLISVSTEILNGVGDAPGRQETQ